MRRPVDRDTELGRDGGEAAAPASVISQRLSCQGRRTASAVRRHFGVGAVSSTGRFFNRTRPCAPEFRALEFQEGIVPGAPGR